MSHNDIGPKLRQLRELGKNKLERNAKKPSVSDLRTWRALMPLFSKVAKVKPAVRNQGGKRKR